MIELKVLAVESEGRATEYKISPSPVMLGGKDSYGVEALHLTVPVEWEGCALRVTFTPELCEGITRSVVGDNVVEIDAAITAAPVGKLTVEATNDENQRYFTHSVPYVVYDHEAVGKDIPAPNSDLWQQFVDDTLANANAAKAARDAAQAAEANALQDRDEAREAAQNAAIFAGEAAESAENAKTAADEAGNSAREAEGFAERAEKAAVSANAAEQNAANNANLSNAHAERASSQALAAQKAASEALIYDGNALTAAERAETAAKNASEKAAELSSTAVPAYVTFGTTTYEETLEICKRNVSVYCRYYSYVAHLSVVNEAAGAISFYMHNVAGDDDGLYYFAVSKKLENNGANGWVQNKYTHASKDYVDEKAKSFYAVYGETTYNEIATAFQKGASVYVTQGGEDGYYCVGYLAFISASQAIFCTALPDGRHIHLRLRSSDNYWDSVFHPYVLKDELDKQIGDIETAIDNIIEIQNSLIGGDAE